MKNLNFCFVHRYHKAVDLWKRYRDAAAAVRAFTEFQEGRLHALRPDDAPSTSQVSNVCIFKKNLFYLREFFYLEQFRSEKRREFWKFYSMTFLDWQKVMLEVFFLIFGIFDSCSVTDIILNELVNLRKNEI